MLTETDDQRALRSALRDFLTDRTEQGSREFLDGPTGFDPDVWRALGDELGVLGLGVSEDRGGSGGSHREKAVIAEELGRRLVPTPYLSTSVIGVELAAAGADDYSAELLRQLVSGRVIASVPAGAAMLTPAASAQLKARTSDDGFRITGDVPNALHGAEADIALVIAAEDAGPAVFAVPLNTPQVVRTPLHTIDLTRRIARLRFDDAPAHRLDVASATDAAARAYQVGAVLLASEQVGAMTSVLEMTLDYVRDRRQFERPIGSFQAVKHQCADAALLVEQAVSLVRHACDALDGGDRLRVAESAALVGAFVGPSFFQVARDALHLHGGLGYTWEYDAHLYYRKAKSDEFLLTTPGEARRQLAVARFADSTNGATQ
ncbi:acyl-CoA dehydrogenase family protein [Cumulibacter soli]|uniref:acyl-CoA dehydrogenase family protein n=1 Tax=Cumulibacter soli TaxID=2546344 RepID=UPI0010673857|nr:acyl-CoA dehydrogenase family protein [Cumulibacter soli]